MLSSAASGARGASWEARALCVAMHSRSRRARLALLRLQQVFRSLLQQLRMLQCNSTPGMRQASQLLKQWCLTPGEPASRVAQGLASACLALKQSAKRHHLVSNTAPCDRQRSQSREGRQRQGLVRAGERPGDWNALVGDELTRNKMQHPIKMCRWKTTQHNAIATIQVRKSSGPPPLAVIRRFQRAEASEGSIRAAAAASTRRHRPR